MDGFTALPVSLPGLHAVRGTTTSLHTGVKDRYGIGRIERGDTEWWGSGKVWRPAPGCILVKQPGDVVRHLSHRGPTTYTAVMLPTHDVAHVRSDGKAVVIPQLEAGDERAAPFQRLLDAVCAGVDRLALEVALAEAVSAGMRRQSQHSSVVWHGFGLSSDTSASEQLHAAETTHANASTWVISPKSCAGRIRTVASCTSSLPDVRDERFSSG
jgi:hypothetical protein